MRKFPDGAVGSDAQGQGNGASNAMTILAIDPGPPLFTEEALS